LKLHGLKIIRKYEETKESKESKETRDYKVTMLNLTIKKLFNDTKRMEHINTHQTLHIWKPKENKDENQNYNKNLYDHPMTLPNEISPIQNKQLINTKKSFFTDNKLSRVLKSSKINYSFNNTFNANFDYGYMNLRKKNNKQSNNINV